MAFEDAETLCYTLARILSPDATPSTLSTLVKKWEHHRFDRIAKVIQFTTKNGDLRKSSPHFYEKAAKEWIMWADFKWKGEKWGAEWMYSYNAEDVLSALAD